MKDNTIKNIMSSPAISVTTTAEVEHIQELFHLHSFRHIPVTKEGRLVGMINRIDFISKIQNWGTRFVSVKDEPSRTAKDFMFENVLTLAADTSIRQAIHDMKEDKRGVLCVVNESDEVLGIVTLFDLINKHIHRSFYNQNRERGRLMQE